MGPVGYLKYSGTPTRVTRCSAALLDHVFVTHPERIIETLVLIDGLSDHYPICFVHKARVPKSPKSHNDTVKYQSFKNLDKDRSVYDLNNAPWSLLDIFENVIRIHESHIFVLRKIHFKQMKIITVYTQLKQLRNKA